MQLSVLQPELTKAVATVAKAVATRSTMPVLGNILLETDGTYLRVAATNRELTISCWIAAKIAEPGHITVPARLFAEYVGAMPPERIDLALNTKTVTLALSCARHDANIKGIPADQFPLIPLVDSEIDKGAAVLSLRPAGLREMLNQTLIATSDDESRPTMTAVKTTFENDQLIMAATDGYRLTVRRGQSGTEPVEHEREMLVPGDTLRELARIAADVDEERPILVVAPERDCILFRLHTKGEPGRRVEIVTNLIDAKFPPYESIIPKSHHTVTTVDTAALLKAVRVAHLFARDNANRLQLHIDPEGFVRLEAQSAEMGATANELEAHVEGDPLDIVFDARFLIDILNQIPQPQVVIETTVATRPASIRPVGVASDEFTHVIMPMHPSTR